MGQIEGIMTSSRPEQQSGFDVLGIGETVCVHVVCYLSGWVDSRSLRESCLEEVWKVDPRKGILNKCDATVKSDYA